MIASTATVERHGWWRRIDLLVCVLAVTALVVYGLHGFDGFLKRDIAIYSYAGQQVAEGVPPYMGILNRAGPLSHLLPAIGVAAARMGGFDDLLGMRVLYMLFSVASVCTVYLLSRDLFASRLAGLAAAATFLVFSGFIKLATEGPREKTPMVLFLLLALWAVVKRRWFAAGFCLSLATLVWQPAFLIGMMAVLTALIGVRTGRVAALFRVGLGGAVPVVVSIVYFVAVGALDEFIDAFLLINARYTTPMPLFENVSLVWKRVEQFYGVSLWPLLVGLAALAPLTLMAISLRKSRTPSRVSVAVIGAAGLTALAWSFRDFNSWPDAFPLLPMAAVGIGGIAKEVTERLPSRAALALTVAWSVAAVAVAANFSMTDRGQRLLRQRDAVRAMLEQLPDDASIMSIQAPAPLVLSRMRNPTRHQTFKRGLDRYVDDAYPGGLSGFAEWVGQEEPTTISMAGPVPPWLRETIEEEYRRAGRAPGWRWFVHRSVAADLRADFTSPDVVSSR